MKAHGKTIIRHYQTIPFKDIEPFFLDAMQHMGMGKDTRIFLRALGLTPTTMNTWRKRGEIKFCYPLAVEGLLAERGFVVGLGYKITKRGETTFVAVPGLEVDGSPPLTREELKLVVRALVGSLADCGLKGEAASTAGALIHSMLDDLWGVEPPTEEHAPVGASARSTRGMSMTATEVTSLEGLPSD